VLNYANERTGIVFDMANAPRLRRITGTDLASVVALLDLAFAPSRYESRLIRDIMAKGRPAHQWVLDDDGSLVSHVCYTRAYRDGRPIGFHLAPVAVHPDRQRSGHGSRLIADTLKLAPLADSPVFVLGDPAYYSRFGFRRVEQPTCPFDPGNAHFQALRYSSAEDFEVGYEPEFLEAP
jgi:putative acetyltransferase